MTNRERLLAIMEGNPPDRIPWIPRMLLWWLAPRNADTLPEKYRGWRLRDIEMDLGMGAAARDGRVYYTRCKNVETVVRLDGQDSLHRRHLDDQRRPLVGGRATGQACAGATAKKRDAVVAAQADQLLHFRRCPWQGDRQRRLAMHREAIALVGHHRDVVSKQALRRQDPAQSVEELDDGSLLWAMQPAQATFRRQLQPPREAQSVNPGTVGTDGSRAT